MKYILIEHGDDNKKYATVFETCDARVKATREAILGPDNDGEPCPELLTLADEGIVHFEGDPPLEWIDAEVSWPENKATGRAEGLREAFKDKQRMDKLQEWADKFIVEFCAYSDNKIDLVAKEVPDGRTESLRIAWSVSAAKNLREAIDQISEWQTRRVGLKDNQA